MVLHNVKHDTQLQLKKERATTLCNCISVVWINIFYFNLSTSLSSVLVSSFAWSGVDSRQAGGTLLNEKAVVWNRGDDNQSTSLSSCSLESLQRAIHRVVVNRGWILLFVLQNLRECNIPSWSAAGFRRARSVARTVPYYSPASLSELSLMRSAATSFLWWGNGTAEVNRRLQDDNYAAIEERRVRKIKPNR